MNPIYSKLIRYVQIDKKNGYSYKAKCGRDLIFYYYNSKYNSSICDNNIYKNTKHNDIICAPCNEVKKKLTQEKINELYNSSCLFYEPSIDKTNLVFEHYQRSINGLNVYLESSIVYSIRGFNYGPSSIGYMQHGYYLQIHVDRQNTQLNECMKKILSKCKCGICGESLLPSSLHSISSKKAIIYNFNISPVK
jgi:hypothetical protein